MRAPSEIRIGNKPPASVLKSQWDQALFEFDLGERSRMSYWVDRERYPVPLEAVSSGGDYADATEEAPHGEFSPKALRAPWSPTLELEDIEDDIVDLLASTEEGVATSKQAERLHGIAAKMLGESILRRRLGVRAGCRRLQGAAERKPAASAQRYGAQQCAQRYRLLPRRCDSGYAQSHQDVPARVTTCLSTKLRRPKRTVVARADAAQGRTVHRHRHSHWTMIAYPVRWPEFRRSFYIRVLAISAHHSRSMNFRTSSGT